jgi:hypothetical protein
MLPTTTQLCALSILLSSCGDLRDEIRKADIAGTSDIENVNESQETENNPALQNKPMCLTDCDNDSWKYLTVEELKLPAFTAPDGCILGTSAAFAAAPDIDVLTVVTCAGTSRLFLWRVNTTGSIVRVPAQIAQCPLGYFFGNLRRQAGTSGVMTLWRCADKDTSYPSYRVRFENSSGMELYSTILTPPSSINTYPSEIGYSPEADVWGVATGWNFQRFKSWGAHSGVTTLSTTSPRSVLSRYGLFQIASGNSLSSATSCTRVSTSGALLCNSTDYSSGITSATPIDGSNFVLLQTNSEARAGTDTASSCNVSVKATTLFRHNRTLNFIRAIASEGGPYAASLAIEKTTQGESLVLSLFEINAALWTVNHLISIPLGSSSVNNGLFRIAERIYATWSEGTNVKIVSIPKPQTPK